MHNTARLQHEAEVALRASRNLARELPRNVAQLSVHVAEVKREIQSSTASAQRAECEATALLDRYVEATALTGAAEKTLGLLSGWMRNAAPSTFRISKEARLARVCLSRLAVHFHYDAAHAELGALSLTAVEGQERLLKTSPPRLMTALRLLLTGAKASLVWEYISAPSSSAPRLAPSDYGRPLTIADLGYSSPAAAAAIIQMANEAELAYGGAE